MRIDADAIRNASDERMSAAFDLGKQLGLQPAAISQDLSRAQSSFAASHRSAPTASAKLAGLNPDLDNCIGDDFGRPND